MSLLADALQPSTVSRLTQVGGYAGRVSIPDFIVAESKIGFYIDFDIHSKLVRIDYREPILIRPLASDCCRMASSCFQTAVSVRQEGPSKIGIPWFIIKMYYAAFYAAHSLFRIFGDSCSFLHHNHINRLFKLYESSGRAVPFTLERGLYMCNLDVSASSMNCKKIVGGSGGSHEAFWDEFGLRVGRLGEAALSAPLSPFETQEVFNKLESLRKIMKQGGASSSSWLSYIRNEIQYRQQFDAWIPSSMKSGEQNSLWRLGEKWTKDPLSIELNVSDKSLHKFVSACAFIISGLSGDASSHCRTIYRWA
jgi:hypothetical protein